MNTVVTVELDKKTVDDVMLLSEIKGTSLEDCMKIALDNYCHDEKSKIMRLLTNHEDLRINPDNGVALCKWCHGKYHSYYGISSANPQTLIKFIRRFGRF